MRILLKDDIMAIITDTTFSISGLISFSVYQNEITIMCKEGTYIIKCDIIKYASGRCYFACHNKAQTIFISLGASKSSTLYSISGSNDYIDIYLQSSVFILFCKFMFTCSILQIQFDEI